MHFGCGVGGFCCLGVFGLICWFGGMVGFVLLGCLGFGWILGVLGLVRDLGYWWFAGLGFGLVCVDGCGCLVCDLPAGFRFGRV